MLKVSDISAKKLRNDQFQKELPEFFDLKNFVENNEWHSNVSVFNHSLAVLEELEKLLESANNSLIHYLDKKIGSHTRKELLFLVALFHDIAKSSTLVKNGIATSCPKHEAVGSEKIMPILERFDLSEQEKAMVADIIKHHGELHDILNSKNNKIGNQFHDFKSQRHDIFAELILLAMADTLGSQLKENNPDSFKFRIDFYKHAIENY
jgi:UTP:GlnB (protein PII) uridylyltransferase